MSTYETYVADTPVIIYYTIQDGKVEIIKIETVGAPAGERPVHLAYEEHTEMCSIILAKEQKEQSHERVRESYDGTI